MDNLTESNRLLPASTKPAHLVKLQQQICCMVACVARPSSHSEEIVTVCVHSSFLGGCDDDMFIRNPFGGPGLAGSSSAGKLLVECRAFAGMCSTIEICLVRFSVFGWSDCSIGG